MVEVELGGVLAWTGEVFFGCSFSFPFLGGFCGVGDAFSLYCFKERGGRMRLMFFCLLKIGIMGRYLTTSLTTPPAPRPSHLPPQFPRLRARCHRIQWA